MSSFLCSALTSFRPVFSRHRTWLLFCMIILGFIGATEMVGVTSICRFWGLGESGFHSLLNFFRSEAYSLTTLVHHWTAFILAQGETITIHDRVILTGDHTYVPKDGRQMPGVVTLHQNSETQSKPSYFRGHCWGAICLAIGSIAEPFAIPVALGLHQGQIHIGEKDISKESKTMGPRIIQMALDFSLRHNKPCILILDAFFPCASVFNLANSIWSVESKQPLVTLIIKAKSNCVAYFKAEKIIEKKPGRPKFYGDKVKLSELFDHQHLFSTVNCLVYGTIEEVSILSVDLLWRPIGRTVRFVLAVSSRGPIVLMCTELNQDPKIALELYCMRTRIETTFDMLKNLMGTFHYRFWSKMMPRHSRTPKSNQLLKQPSSEAALKKVKLCWDACERFVMMSAMSLGLLQLISIKFKETIWGHFDVYLRTQSRNLPSERTVKYVISRFFVKDICSSASNAIIQEIKGRFLGKNTDLECNISSG